MLGAAEIGNPATLNTAAPTILFLASFEAPERVMQESRVCGFDTFQ